MNVINVIANRAQQDDEILVVMVNRWMIGEKRSDPIPDILLKSDGIFYGFLAFLLTLSILLVLAWRVIRHSFTIGDHSMGWIMVCQAILMNLAFWKIYKSKKAISDPKNADDFCRAFELIEQIHQKKNKTDIPWLSYTPEEFVSKAADQYLREQAGLLMKIEKISWRKDQERAFRKRFDWEFDVLTRLMLIPHDRRDYFKAT